MTASLNDGVAERPETAQVVSALWSAVWALEDQLSTIRRIQAAHSPPPYARALIEKTEQEVGILRAHLRGMSSLPPGPGDDQA